MTVYGERFSNSDFSGAPRYYQPFMLPRMTKVKAIRTWFVHYNNPSFTELKLRIHANQGGVATDQLFESNKTYSPAQLYTLAYGLHEVWFDFTNPIWLRENTLYHLAPYVSGAAFTASSFISWVKGFPDPNIETETPVAYPYISRMPFYMAVIGADR